MTSSDNVIVITGVSRGLGAAMCRLLCEAGHAVQGIARDRNVISQLTTSARPNCSFSVVDVADHGQVAEWAKSILDSHGPPDLILNNAGVINRNANLWEVPHAEFAKVLQVNVAGIHNVVSAFLPAMIARGQGGVVNFSSTWGQTTSPKVAPYCASKWAVEGLTQALSQELPSGMFAVACNPGIINTDMLRSCFGAEASAYPSADQWAGVAVPFLLQLSPDDNGQSVRVPC